MNYPDNKSCAFAENVKHIVTTAALNNIISFSKVLKSDFYQAIFQTICSLLLYDA
jgi:hypothetical protein